MPVYLRARILLLCCLRTPPFNSFGDPPRRGPTSAPTHTAAGLRCTPRYGRRRQRPPAAADDKKGLRTFENQVCPCLKMQEVRAGGARKSPSFILGDPLSSDCSRAVRLFPRSVVSCNDAIEPAANFEAAVISGLNTFSRFPFFILRERHTQSTTPDTRNQKPDTRHALKKAD